MSFSAPSSYAPEDSARNALVERLRTAPRQTVASDGATPGRSGKSLILPFVIAVLILLGTTGYGLLRPQNHAHTSPSAPGQPGSLVWGDGLFANRQELSAWLHQHGMSFARFARNHPAALKLVP